MKLFECLRPKCLIEKIQEDEFRISLFVLAVAFLVVNLPTILGGRYLQKEFLESMLSNANSMILDILIILCLTTWLIRRSEKRREVQRLEDEIDDFRRWNSDEAAHRIRGSILRLNKLDISKIKLSFCNLENADLAGAKLGGSDLHDTNFKNAFLQNADLSFCNLGRANLCGCNLSDANLEGAHLEKANLEGADASGINLQYADLANTRFSRSILIGSYFYGANMDGAELIGADIQGTYDLLDAEELQSADFTDAIMDDEVRESLSRINPTVKPLEKPIRIKPESDSSA